MYCVFLIQGVSQLFTSNSISMKMDCHELILPYCGNRLRHKFIALSTPCTVTFVDKEEGQPSMGFWYGKKKFLLPLAPNMFGSPVGKEEGQSPSDLLPSSPNPPASSSSAPMRACPAPVLYAVQPDQFDAAAAESLQTTLATKLEVAPYRIQVISVLPGSTVVVFQVCHGGGTGVAVLGPCRWRRQEVALAALKHTHRHTPGRRMEDRT